MSGDPALEEGWVGRELALEFPELRLVSVVAPAPGRRTPSVLRERLALLADRFHGARALTLRREPVPHAYRAFFRQVGLDPDAQRTPVEAAALDRLVQGGFASRGPLEDALLVAVVETGVPVWALDDVRLDGPWGCAARRRASAWARASTQPTSSPGASWSPTPAPRWRCSSAMSPAVAVPRATARACGSSPSRFPGCRRCTSRRPCSAARRRFQTPVVPSRLGRMLDVRDVRGIADERAARSQLRDQIATLEAQLSDAVIGAFPEGGAHSSVRAPGGPRVLTLGELERIRDALADRVAQARALLAERGERQEASRALLERMLLEPGRYKFVRVAKRDLGDSGCGVWHVRPRLGLIGMLMGWWQVKLSSGCPLAS